MNYDQYEDDKCCKEAKVFRLESNIYFHKMSDVKFWIYDPFMTFMTKACYPVVEI